MTSSQAIVRNGYGIHCRPAAIIAKAAMQSDAAVVVVSPDGKRVDARSTLALLGLGLQHGANVVLEVDGPDEDEVCRRMAALFAKEFDFSR